MAADILCVCADLISISSVFGYTSTANLAAYVASKHAVVGLHESLRFELDSMCVFADRHKAPFVRTTLVCPGHMDDTKMFANVKYNDAARFFTPVTKSGVVASRIIDAIRRQESTVIQVPSYVRLAPALDILPSFLRDFVQRVIGADSALPSK